MMHTAKFADMEFYTVPEAAKLLGISERVLRDKLKSGVIKGYKFLGKWFIFKEDLAKAIKGKSD